MNNNALLFCASSAYPMQPLVFGVDPVQKLADKVAEITTAASDRLKREFGGWNISHPLKLVPYRNSKGTALALLNAFSSSLFPNRSYCK